jgi:hypothetical protein
MIEISDIYAFNLIPDPWSTVVGMCKVGIETGRK